ncbi:MAG: ISKra4 family transposase [Chloroflexi bacterium]|nr:ISKra4 family transposase [Chloroflexota bacterium]
MSELLNQIVEFNPQYHQLAQRAEESVHLKSLTITVFILAKRIAVTIVEEILSERAQEMGDRPVCPICGEFLHSKGMLDRSMLTIIGMIFWRRRGWRCVRGCQIGQITPFDIELGIKPNQRVGDDVKQALCGLAIFIPFQTVSILFKSITGIEVSPKSIWNFVQCMGKKAISQLDLGLEALKNGILPDAVELPNDTAKLPLVFGADGVMVPFRPNGGKPNGKIVWREIKVGIFARIGNRITKKGKKVSIIVRRRVVALLGKIDEFKPYMWHMALCEGILQAPKAVWLSDGGRGFWRLYNEQFAEYAYGILDFFHAVENIWKAAKEWLDGRTNKAKAWFSKTRKDLKLGKHKKIVKKLRKTLSSEKLSDSAIRKIENVAIYLETHKNHINYDKYKELGLPIGSGIVESTCKWLIQQRFKGVGMRWSEDGFSNLLNLRIAWVNESFDGLFDS